ncbi:Cytosol aminopeptidase family, catalytic domain [Rhizoctonia solani]|uniref:Cytosol aminopeptidase family, catalytic domain n=1 Tax=Rhizoctonia solani TaxID=456999 RepID=A0A8H7IM14_9AGAM|nr:Cytosol aminopeptidase family, catalytic domain [Rhizoctonia solani]
MLRLLPRAPSAAYNPIVRTLNLRRTMVHDAYLVPIDPAAPASTSLPSIASLWQGSKPKDKAGETRLFYNVDNDGRLAAAVSLGTGSNSKTPEALKRAVGTGIKKLRDAGATSVIVDGSSDLHAAAVGAHLALFKYNHLKTAQKDAVPSVSVSPSTGATSSGELGWESGIIYAYSQNLARELMETPANLLTPTLFAERIKKEFEGLENVEIKVRDKAWAEEKGMRTFLSVAKGSSEPCKFLEIHYKGASEPNAQPLVFVGKGITFDSGGISLKPSANMKLMRGDMGGAAAVSSATLAIAKLKIPINVVTLVALTENMPGPAANKPGDVIYAINGKTVEVDNTDAEGRLILSDTLWYGSSEFNPHTIIDCATLTGAMDVALGTVYSGVFSTSDTLWNELNAAGLAEHDRFWRMPLDEAYGPQIYSSNADLCNTGGKSAGSCTAALFLKSFVKGIASEDDQGEAAVRWAHVDIAGTMDTPRGDAYQEKGMTGRPVRAPVVKRCLEVAWRLLPPQKQSNRPRGFITGIWAYRYNGHFFRNRLPKCASIYDAGQMLADKIPRDETERERWIQQTIMLIENELLWRAEHGIPTSEQVFATPCGTDAGSHLWKIPIDISLDHLVDDRTEVAFMDIIPDYKLDWMYPTRYRTRLTYVIDLEDRAFTINGILHFPFLNMPQSIAECVTMHSQIRRNAYFNMNLRGAISYSMSIRRWPRSFCTPSEGLLDLYDLLSPTVMGLEQWRTRSWEELNASESLSVHLAATILRDQATQIQNPDFFHNNDRRMFAYYQWQLITAAAPLAFDLALLSARFKFGAFNPHIDISLDPEDPGISNLSFPDMERLNVVGWTPPSYVVPGLLDHATPST